MAKLSLSFDALRKLFGWKLDKDEDEEEEYEVVAEKLMAPSSEPFDFDTQIPSANSVIESQENRVRKANEKAIQSYADLFCPERIADICRKIFDCQPYMPTSRVVNFVSDLADPDLCKAIQVWRTLYAHDFQFDLKEEFAKPWKPLLDKGWSVDLHAYTTDIHGKEVANIYLSVEAKQCQAGSFNITVDVF